MKKILFVLSALVFSAAGISAQQVVITHDYSAFSGVQTSNSFDLSFMPSDHYSIKITADTALEDYILEVDEKGMPSDVKKEFKAKNNAAPAVKAVIFAPKFNFLVLGGNSSVTSEHTIDTDMFSITASKSAVVSRLGIKAEKILVNISNKAKVYANCEASSSLTVNAEHNSLADLKIKTGTLDVSSCNFAVVKLVGDADGIRMSSEGNSKIEYNNVRP